MRFKMRRHLGALAFGLSDLFVWLMNSRCRFDRDRLFHDKDAYGRGQGYDSAEQPDGPIAHVIVELAASERRDGDADL
jgi:hypothetical protein